jgi:hypothetical protein
VHRRPRALQRKAGEMALEGMSGTQRFLAGAGKGMTDVARGVGQLFGAGNQSAIDEARLHDAALTNSGAGMAGDIAGNVALTAIPGIGAQGLLARGTTALSPASDRSYGRCSRFWGVTWRSDNAYGYGRDADWCRHRWSGRRGWRRC